MRSILTLSLLTGALLLRTPGAQAQRPGPGLPEGVKMLRDLEYARAGERPLLLDLYLPDKAAGPLPVIVWVHGGGWRAGSKAGCSAVRLVPHGYAVASVGYRLSGVATFPAQIEDCKAAIRWLRARAKEYRLNPEHFGAWGSSARGRLAALPGTTGDVKDIGPGR